MLKKLLIITTLILSINALGNEIDANIVISINNHRNKSFDGFNEAISNSIYPIGILTPTSLFLYGYFTKNEYFTDKSIRTGAALLLNIAITYSVKYAIHRKRPYNTYSEINNVVFESSASMPSGHTSIAFATATSLTLTFPKWYVAAPAYTWATMVGYSRMHLGVHYPSDVLVGALIGTGCAFISFKANQWLRKKYI